MVDEAETPKVLEEISKSNAAPAKNRSQRKNRNAVKRIVIVLLLLSPLAAGMAFLSYQQWELTREVALVQADNIALSEQLETSRSVITQLQEVVVALGADGSADEQLINQLRDDYRAEIARVQTRLGEVQSRLQIGQAEANNLWQLAEVEYMLRLANQQLQLASNVTAAITILRSADTALADLADSRTLPVRQALEQEIAALRRIAIVDTEGVYISLQNLDDRVNAISFSTSIQDAYRERLAAPFQESSGAEVVADQSLLDEGLEFLGSVFIWRRWDESPETMYPPQQAYFARNAISLALQQAQLALMTRQSDIYTASIVGARDLFNQYLANLTAEEGLILEDMEVLLEVNLQPQLPDITGSLSRLRELRANVGDAQVER